MGALNGSYVQQNGVSHRCVIEDLIVVPLIGVELHAEPSDIAQALW